MSQNASQTSFKVFEAINQVQAELSRTGIAKDRRNESQKFNFRGVDDVYNELAPLLAQHNLVVLPRFTDRQIEWRTTKSGTEMAHVCVRGSFVFASSLDGSTVEVSTFGEAMDSGDKATNKAMSAAYKYAAFQAFCIPTEGDDGDADSKTPPPSTRKAAPTAAPTQSAPAPRTAATPPSPSSPPPATSVVDDDMQALRRVGAAGAPKWMADLKAAKPDHWAVNYADNAPHRERLRAVLAELKGGAGAAA